MYEPLPQLQQGSTEDLFKSIIHNGNGGNGGNAGYNSPRAIPFPISFADAFTFSLLAVYSFPIAALTYVAFQKHVAYWLGRWCLFVWVIPALLAWGYMAIVRQYYRRKVVVLTCILVPCTLLFILGNIYLHNSSTTASQLLADDCNTFDRKRDLETAWKAAHAIWTKCVDSTVAATGINRTEAVRITKVHHCDGYDNLYSTYRQQWEYLQFLELNRQCAGWCEAHDPLWSFNDVKDSCSTSVGLMMHLALRRTSLQIFTFSGAILVVAVGVVIVDPLRKLGWE
jgi:hypothetical protein